MGNINANTRQNRRRRSFPVLMVTAFDPWPPLSGCRRSDRPGGCLSPPDERDEPNENEHHQRNGEIADQCAELLWSLLCHILPHAAWQTPRVHWNVSQNGCIFAEKIKRCGRTPCPIRTVGPKTICT